MPKPSTLAQGTVATRVDPTGWNTFVDAINDLVDKVWDPTIHEPSAIQVINAAGDAILANATLVVLNPDGDYTLTSTPTIADGTIGQMLKITCANAEAHTVTIQDQDTLGSSNLQLLATTKDITGKTVTTLIFDGVNWVEYGGGAGVSGGTREIALDFKPAAYADGADNAGTVTKQHDNTNHRNFWRWSSGSANQDIDLVWEFRLPPDFDAWTATNAFYIDTRSNSFAGHVLTASLYIAAGTVDAGISAVDIKPDADNTWQSKSDLPTDTYAAGDQIHLHIHMDCDTASDTLDISRIYFTYTATY